MVIGIVGIVAILAVAALVITSLPGDVPQGQVNNKGQNAVAIGSAAFTAIATIVGAYFGVKVANVAREDAAKEGEKSTLQVAALAGALPESSALEALEKAEGWIAQRQQH